MKTTSGGGSTRKKTRTWVTLSIASDAASMGYDSTRSANEDVREMMECPLSAMCCGHDNSNPHSRKWGGRTGLQEPHDRVTRELEWEGANLQLAHTVGAEA